MFRRYHDKHRSPFFNHPRPYRQQTNITQKRSNNPTTPPLKIKTLIEIAKPTVEIHLSKNFKLNKSIDQVIDISWEVSALHYHLVFSEKKVWISGELIAEITYTKKKNSDLHIYKGKIPLNKICQIDYIHHPEIAPSSGKRHYEFVNPNDPNETTTHFEQIFYEQKPSLIDTIYTKITSSKNICFERKQPFLVLNIHCEIQFQVFQNKTITINNHSL